MSRYTPAPMKYLLAILVAFSLSSCGLLDSFSDPLADVRVSRSDASVMATALEAANATLDLDSDGDINGWEEWYAWVKTFVQASRVAADQKEEPIVPKD